jgi:glycyl-tRNA synthetase
MSEKLRGPPANRAFDAAGAPTKALIGFCTKNGVTPEECSVEPDSKGTEYCFATVQNKGKAAGLVLEELLPAVVNKLAFPRSMRWQTEAAFSRPLRTLLALHGDHLVPFHALGVASGPLTRLLRNADQTEATVSSASEFEGVMAAAGIVLDINERKNIILTAAKDLAKSVGGEIPSGSQGDLLDEIANLVEAPTPVLGTFDPAFLDLPKEVLVMVMRKHQRYFPVEDADGALLPYFVTVANGTIDPSTVQAGNEAVLRARYEDARFFYKVLQVNIQ